MKRTVLFAAFMICRYDGISQNVDAVAIARQHSPSENLVEFEAKAGKIYRMEPSK
jgi:hypothetical protein